MGGFLFISLTKKYFVFALLVVIIVISIAVGKLLFCPVIMDKNFFLQLLKPKLVSVEIGFITPEFRETITIKNEKDLKQIGKVLPASKIIAGPIKRREIFWWIKLNYSNQSSANFLATKGLKFYDPSEEAWIDNKELVNLLVPFTNRLENNFFGEFLDWNEVNSLFPKNTKAEVRDLETGIILQVFRYGGIQHADVEPVTLDDVQKLKNIFDGSWTWKRRAVVLTIGERRIAASMNGMPHDGGKIRDNRFIGHFCIHFRDSKIHKSLQPDPGHQLMVKKSSGLIWNDLKYACPDDFVSILLIALSNGDSIVARYVFDDNEIEKSHFWTAFAKKIRFLQINEIRTIEENETRATVKAFISVYFFDPKKNLQHHGLRIKLNRPNTESSWTADLENLATSLESQGETVEKRSNIEDIAGCYYEGE